MKYKFSILLLFSCSLILFLQFKDADIEREGSEDLSQEKRELKSPEQVLNLDSTDITIETIAAHLDVAWEITWGPDNWIWFTEQNGSVSKVNPATGEQKLLLRIVPDVYRHRTLGLLSMTLHPDMKNHPYVFLNYTYRKKDELWSRWVRYTYTGTTLNEPFVFLEVPADIGHNGSRIIFAPDGKLMLATGDADHRNNAANGGNAQNMQSLSGKILRLNIDGTIPADNPFPESPVWAKGLRVPQGLVYASNGNLYSAEHGHTTDDEVNLIKKGGNYGYPNIAGACNEPEEKEFCATHNVIEPIIAWTPTVAPAGLDYYNNSAIPEWQNSLLLVTLKTQSLRVLKLNEKGDQVINESVYFEKEFGRLRDICVSPEGDIYISTSNRDWNPVEGFPQSTDDRIIKISSNKKSKTHQKNISSSNQQKIKKEPKKEPVKPSKNAQAAQSPPPGLATYKSYCASCHKEDGTGVPGTFPPLKGAPQVQGDKNALIKIVVQGLSGPIEVNGVDYNMEMPAFNFLSDTQIADVVEYIRSEFGNINDTVTPDEVKKIKHR